MCPDVGGFMDPAKTTVCFDRAFSGEGAPESIRQIFGLKKTGEKTTMKTRAMLVEEKRSKAQDMSSIPTRWRLGRGDPRLSNLWTWTLVGD